MNSDARKLESEIARLEKLAYYDELTGALNRRGFIREVRRRFDPLPRRKSIKERRILSFVVMFVDVDDFKSINDTYGHKTGDKTLKRVVKAMRAGIRKTDILARWGGDEFVIVLFDATPSVAVNVVDKVKSKFKQITFKKKEKITASMGFVSSRKYTDLPTMITMADKAMCRVKANRRP